ncbi:hypothetical protein BHE74_00027277 [Ensete ventricosum]|nr:hypothetical protein BHE74_00027277 [Ensete ventricosum]
MAFGLGDRLRRVLDAWKRSESGFPKRLTLPPGRLSLPLHSLSAVSQFICTPLRTIANIRGSLIGKEKDKYSISPPSEFMGPDHVVVVDISSDEEDLGLDPSHGLSFDSFEVLDRSDGRRQEESDDVVIVDEFWASAAKRRKKHSGLLGPDKGSGFDDDDCLVLDSDPDKPVSVVDDKGREVGDRGDDLLIVAEKGQVRPL